MTDYLRNYPVLYVDDEDGNLRVFRSTFCDEFEVICADGGRAALEALEARRVGVLLSDHKMPDMTGIELCEQVRLRHPEVVRMIVTAFSDHATAVDAINRGGVKRFIDKPWEEDEVRRVLREVISEQHIATTQQRLRDAMVERERLAGVAALRAEILHDLANFTGVIADSCRALEDLMDSPAGEQLQRLSQAHSPRDARREIQRLRTAVDYVVGLHRRTRRQGTLVPGARSYHRVADILDTVTTLMRQRRGRAAILSQADPQIYVYADHIDVIRILGNLVSNALQAMTEAETPDPRVWLSARRNNDWVELRVEDNGPGIPRERRGDIFELFYSTRHETGGSGLGLAICRELAAANGGNIGLEDTSEGAGSVFSLTLPTEPVKLGSEGDDADDDDEPKILQFPRS